MRRLNRVDLPALGRPTIATTGRCPEVETGETDSVLAGVMDMKFPFTPSPACGRGKRRTHAQYYLGSCTKSVQERVMAGTAPATGKAPGAPNRPGPALPALRRAHPKHQPLS